MDLELWVGLQVNIRVRTTSLVRSQEHGPSTLLNET
jgi:hypothetical protein